MFFISLTWYVHLFLSFIWFLNSAKKTVFGNRHWKKKTYSVAKLPEMEFNYILGMLMCFLSTSAAESKLVRYFFLSPMIENFSQISWGRCVPDRMVVGFMTTCAIRGIKYPYPFPTFFNLTLCTLWSKNLLYS